MDDRKRKAVIVQTRMRKENVERLDRYAEQLDQKRSAIVRSVVLAYLEHMDRESANQQLLAVPFSVAQYLFAPKRGRPRNAPDSEEE